MKRIIIDGAMNHDSGADKTKLVTMIAGIQKKACCARVGVIKTDIRPTPKTTAFTIK
jgi:nucleoside-triphosphatase THEP1